MTPETPAPKKVDVLRPVDDAVLALTHKLAVEARTASLGFVDPESGGPAVSRIMIASIGASLLTLISDLSAHAKALTLDPRCALLIGEAGKGDPLAHARMSVIGVCKRLPQSAKDDDVLAGAFLAIHPKAQLYFGFGDFAFWRFEVTRIDLNGGFGKASRLSAGDWKKAMARDVL
jgi:heme iron utilization protein